MKHPVAWIVAAALLAHVWGLSNGFVYDDRRFITENSALESASIQELVLDAALQTSDQDRDVYRPLRALGHAFDLRRWGLEPFGFHLHSLLAHVLNAVLAWWALKRLLPKAGPWPAMLGAMALATHPLGVEAVDWVTSRGDLYALGFGLAALAIGVEQASPTRPAQRWARDALSALCACLAVMSKESAAMLPVIALWHRQTLGGRSRRQVMFLLLGVLAALALRHHALEGGSPMQTAPHGGSPVAQVAWALFGTGISLGHLIWPVHLQIEYSQEEWLEALPVWLSLPLWSAVACMLAVWAWRRSRPELAFVLGWMLLAYLPSSSLLVTLRNLVNDRAAYPLLPAFGAALVLCIPRRARGSGRILGTALLVAIPTLLWSLLSMARIPVFHDEAALWNDVIAQHPQSAKAHLSLAWTAGSGSPVDQRQHLLHAAQYSARGTRIHALALAELGDLILRQDADPARAEPILVDALKSLTLSREKAGPSSEELATVGSLATAWWSLGRDAAAIDLLHQARAESPTQVMLPALETTLWIARARSTNAATDWSRARDAYERASALDPQHPLVMSLAQALAARTP